MSSSCTTRSESIPPPLPLTTARLSLRHYRADDAEPLLRYYSKPDVVRFLLDEVWDLAQAEEQVSRRMGHRNVDGPGSRLAVVVELGRAVIGCVSLWPTDDTLSAGEIGWVFDPSYGGRGYATEAVRAVIAIGFDLGMHRIKAQLDPRNTPSVRLCERVGMTKEAHLRQDWWNKGEWTDNAIYGLLRSDATFVATHGSR